MSDALPERRSRPGRLSRGAAWLLAVAVAGSALAVGSVHTTTLCIVTVVLAVAASLAWWRAEPMHVRPVATLMLVLAVALTAFTALQCVPMPLGWLAAIAPHNADVWSRALTPLHEPGPSWAPVSLDPPATRVEVLKGIAYLLAFLTALRVARSREGVQFLCNALLASAVLVAVAALVNVGFHEGKLFGLYTPHDPVMPRHMAPLLNPNHLAAYLNVGFCVALASLSDREAGTTTRTIGLVAAVLLGAMVLWVASRGGVAAMVLGGLLVFAILRTRNARARTGPAVVGLMVVAGVTMAVLAQSDGPFDTWAELADTDVSKVTYFREAARLLRPYPVLGTGRGAFAGAFPEVRTMLGNFSVSNPENVLLQWSTEWGLPLAVVALITLVVALRPSVVLARAHAALGAWVALSVVAVHNLVDFSAEVPGVTIALAVAVGVVVGGVRVPGGAQRIRWHAWADRPRRVAVAVALVAAGGLAVAVPVIGHEPVADRDAMARLVLAPLGPPEAFRAVVRASMLRHPAEPYFPYAGAVRAARARDESVVPWVERTLERSPVYAGAHMVLAQELRTRFPAQARMEYRMAIEQAGTPYLTVALAKEAAPVVNGFDDAMEVVPDGPERLGVVEPLVEAFGPRLPATCVRLDGLVLAVRGAAPEPLHRVSRAWLQDLEAGPAAPWCADDRPACVAGALKAAQRFEEAAPGECDGYVLEARMRLLAGERMRAVDIVAAHVGTVSDTPACLVSLADVAIDAGDDARATMATDRLAHLPCDDRQECIHNLMSVAQIESRRGNRRRALVFYRRTLELVPEDEWVLSLVADEAMQVGLYAEAIQSYEKLSTRHPDNARYAAGLSRAKAAVYRSETGLP